MFVLIQKNFSLNNIIFLLKSIIFHLEIHQNQCATIELFLNSFNLFKLSLNSLNSLNS